MLSCNVVSPCPKIFHSLCCLFINVSSRSLLCYTLLCAETKSMRQDISFNLLHRALGPSTWVTDLSSMECNAWTSREHHKCGLHAHRAITNDWDQQDGEAVSLRPVVGFSPGLAPGLLWMTAGGKCTTSPLPESLTKEMCDSFVIPWAAFVMRM